MSKWSTATVFQPVGANGALAGVLLQASVLSVKLKHLPAWTQARQARAARYRSALGALVRGFQACPSAVDHVYHLFTVELNARDEVQRVLAEQGIATAVQYPTPLPLLDMFTQGITFVTGRPHVRKLMPEVLDLVRQGKFDPNPMTVNKVPWDDAAEALSDLRAKTVVLREAAA